MRPFPSVQTLLLPTDTPERLAEAKSAAARFLREGKPVALPTETVYGLAADALAPEALVKIFEAKERPFFDPLIIHLPDSEWAEKLAHCEGKVARALMEAFWPGPLTLVLGKRAEVPDLATSGLPSVALRMSAHPVFAAVLGEFGRPLAAPSANRFGRISPTCAQHVFSELQGRIPLIVDAGSTSVGIESTIVAVEGETLRILRPGPIAAEALSAFGRVVQEQGRGEQPEAPGQLKSHYAPRTPMRILTAGSGGAPEGIKCGLLAWQEPREGFAAVEVLSPLADLQQAAAVLFGAMRRLDEAGLDLILAEPVPEHGIGAAIMDRLKKACANG